MPRLRWFLSSACAVVFCACTPISPTRGHSDSGGSGQVESENPAGSASTTAGVATDEGQARDVACSEPDALSCERGDPSRQPLRCENGFWRAQARCAEDEHCSSDSAPSQGTCVKIAQECIGRLPGNEFCDEDAVRVCRKGVSALVRECPDQQRCVMKNGSGKCECASGTIERNGTCLVPTTCEVDNGGCDPLTVCSAQGTTRVCSACPQGFSGGDGSYGCTPMLLALDAAPGQLTPALSEGVTDYRIKLSLLTPMLTLMPKVPDNVRVEINGAVLEGSSSWTSEPLSLGEHTVPLTLTGSNGLSKSYAITVDRSGKQEASIQPDHADERDTFGFSVAIDRDTLLVGATAEDGASGGVNGDETDNAAAESGAAYVFVREGGKWSQQAYLKAPQPQTSEFMGASVAIDGDIALVGATRAGDHVTDVTTLRYRQGVVHIYQRAGTAWTHRASLESGQSRIDWFGWAVAFTEDSILVGAPHDSEDAEASGAVYVFSRSEPYGLVTKLHSPEPSAGGVFGWSLAPYGDSLLIGSPQNTLTSQGPGMVFSYKRVAGSWEPQQKLTASSPSAGASYGWTVALEGDTAVIGAPHPGAPHAQMTRGVPHGDVFLYRQAAGTWTETKQLQASVPRDGDYFGIKVLLSSGTLVVAASGDISSGSGLGADPNGGNLPDAGAFYIFGQRNGDWIFSDFVKSSNTIRGAQFADSAALSGDSIVMSAMHDNGQAEQSGRVYVFR